VSLAIFLDGLFEGEPLDEEGCKSPLLGLLLMFENDPKLTPCLCICSINELRI
jgi:hypothetical protein